LPRKSVEPIALEAGVAPRTLQEFLGSHRWDHEAVRRRIQEIVAKDHADPNAIAVIDETTFSKKGDKTAGVQRQWCGSTGKKDNCVMTVHVGYAAGDFHALVDSDLYLPKASWHEDRARCRAAHIPEHVVHRPKWRIALDLLDRVRANGVRFKFLVADEAYGCVPAFREEAARRGLVYVLEVPCSTAGWLKAPQLEPPPAAVEQRTPGRPRTKARLVPKSRRVDQLWKRGGPSWKCFHVKNTHKGPEVWEARIVRFIPGPNGIPRDECWLIAARHALTGEMKYFLSNAPRDTAPEILLHIAFNRWRIERLFEDGKSHVGLDHFFLVKQTHRLREKKRPLDRAPSQDGDRRAA
jgi:SRSO17 transposase